MLINNFTLLVVNFGGPRNLQEVAPFLKELLTDGDVIRTNWPKFLQDILFRRVAKKRSKRLIHDYIAIGGKSPIYEDTEIIAQEISKRLQCPVITFHRYLTETHQEFFQRIKGCPSQKIIVFPLFPQFSYATTGSIARFFAKHLPRKTLHKLHWIKSYAEHPGFVYSMERAIRTFLEEKNLREGTTFLLFSAHGLPRSFIDEGDPYQTECESSFAKVSACFPHIPSRLCYQSRFGPEEWIQPYTEDVCKDIRSWCGDEGTVVIVPLSFTSDHIETLFEIEQLYLPLIREKGLMAYRLEALGKEAGWLDATSHIIQEAELISNQRLIRS